MKFPVFDLHCDTALALLGEDLCQKGELSRNSGMIDLDRAAALPGYCQCFACFTTPYMEKWYQQSPVTVFEKELEHIIRQLEVNRDRIQLAYTPEQIEENRQKGIQSAVLTVEGPAGFGYDPALLEDLYAIGFRITTLGWNESNPLTGSHVTGEGLTDLGREYVQQAQRLGMLVDVSHISDKGFYDILDITQAPIIASHSNSRAICDCSRNLTDDMFLQICRTGGVAGFNMYRDFIGGAGDLDGAADHFVHLAQLDPQCKHIALGGDLDGCERLPDGFAGVQDYPKLADKLLQRGFTEENVMDIFWNNAMGVMARAVLHNKK